MIDIEDPVDFEQILVDHGRMVVAEAAAIHSDWLDTISERVSRTHQGPDHGRAIAARTRLSESEECEM